MRTLIEYKENVLVSDNVPSNLRKPLFINGNNLEYLTYRRPALELKLHSKSWQNFPLRRLSQICLIGKTKANISDLFEVASRGISVFLFTNKGKALTQLVSVNTQNKILEESFATNLLNESFLYTNTQLVKRFKGISEALIPLDRSSNLPQKAKLKRLGQEIKLIDPKARYTIKKWLNGLLLTTWKKLLLGAGISEHSLMAMQMKKSYEKIVQPWVLFMSFVILTTENDGELLDNILLIFKKYNNNIELVLSNFIYSVIDLTSEPFDFN